MNQGYWKRRVMWRWLVPLWGFEQTGGYMVKRWFLVGVMLLLASLPMVACGMPQKEYDVVLEERDAAQAQTVSVKSDLDKAESEIDSRKSDLATANADLTKLKVELEITQAKYDELSAKDSELSAKHSELSAKYSELSAKYDALIHGTARIKEEDLEQLVFESVNQERQDNGLHELEWYSGLHTMAKDHSYHMTIIKRLEYSEYSTGWQEVFLAVGYLTGDRIANAAMITWKLDPNYKTKFLNEAAKNGAVGVVKSGEYYYITYYADTGFAEHGW